MNFIPLQFLTMTWGWRLNFSPLFILKRESCRQEENKMKEEGDEEATSWLDEFLVFKTWILLKLDFTPATNLEARVKVEEEKGLNACYSRFRQESRREEEDVTSLYPQASLSLSSLWLPWKSVAFIPLLDPHLHLLLLLSFSSTSLTCFKREKTSWN